MEMVEDAVNNAGKEEEAGDSGGETEEEVPHKQKFKNLEQVLHESLYNPLPPQPRETFRYQIEAMKKKVEHITWCTYKADDK